MTDLPPSKPVPPQFPSNETERLAALHRYRILDTPAEAAFDRITRLAARLFGMPTVLISLVDESRAWFKSCIGFDAQEVPRDNTLCSFAVLTDTPLIVPDARQDDRFACNPFVQAEPGVRFYAGAPLLSRDGFNLGTLCLLDSQPHDPLTAEQQATLVDLAALVVDELDLRLAAHESIQSEAKYRTLFESIDEGFCVVEVLFDADNNPIDHRVLQANPAFERQSGIANPEGKTASELVPGVEQFWNDLYAQVIQTGESIRTEIYSDVFDRWFDVLVSRVNDAALPQVAIVFSDISNRKRAEAALRLSEEQSRNILESITDAFFALDENWQFTYVNQTAYALTGYAPGELIGNNFWEAFSGVNDSEFEQMHRRVMRDRVAESLTEFYPDHDRWYEVRTYPAANGVTIYFRNVTEQMQTEAALRESEQRIRNVLESITEAFFALDQNWRFTYMNRAGEVLLDRPPGDLIGKSIWEEYPGLANNELVTIYRGAMDDRVPGTLTAFYPDHDRWYDVRTYPAANGIAAYFNDVTEQIQTETALRQSESRFRLIVESARDYAIFTLNLNNVVTSWNSGAERLLGYSEAEIMGQSGRIIFTPEDMEQGRSERELQLALTQGQAENERWHVRQDGSRFWGSGLVMPMQDEAGTTQGFVKIMQDKTAQRQSEAERGQLLQQEQAAREEAERANRVKDEFLAVLSMNCDRPLTPFSAGRACYRTAS